MKHWMIITLMAAGALVTAQATNAKGLESPYELLAAGEGGVVLVESERVRPEREFTALLNANRKQIYVDQYSQISSSAKDRVVRAYALLKDKGLPERKFAAAVATVIETEMAVNNAKIIVRTWNEKHERANVETYVAAPGIKMIARFAPEIMNI